MRLLARNRAFRHLWAARFLVVLATWSLYTAVPVLIYERTGSALASAVTLAVVALPPILLGPVAGVIADRYDRRRVMRGCALALGGVMLLAAPFAGAAPLALLYAVVALEAVVATVFSPAESALLPSVVEDTDLTAANALNGLNDSLGRIVGPAIGGVVLAQAGFAATLSIAAGLYGLAWLVLRGVTGPGAPDRVAPDGADADDGATAPVSPLAALVGEIREGLAVVTGNRALLLVLLVFAVILIADMPNSAVLPAFVAGSLGAGAAGYGTFVSVRGVAGLLGGVMIASVGQRLPERVLVGGGALAVAVGIDVMGLAGSFAVALVVIVVLGPAIAGMQAGLGTMIQRVTDDATRGRVYGLIGSGSGVIALAGSLAGGGVAELASPAVVIVASGALYVMPAMIVLIVWGGRKMKSHDRVGPCPP